ncbi:MAG: hypothetical protein ACE5HV_15325 [Acidobacteriota bacterium]
MTCWLHRGNHLWVGLAWVIACQILLFADVHIVSLFFTSMVWWGYIVFIDGLVRRLRGRSLLVDYPHEFCNIAAISIPLWLIFEYYNLFLDNWHYVGLPRDPRLRFLGYATAFASILPALLETADLLAPWLGGKRSPAPAPRQLGRRGRLLVAGGGAMLAVPLLFPSRYLFAPVWIGFILLCDPLNARRGLPSLFFDWQRGSVARVLPLFAGGYICGLLWEFWNYWASAKWQYTVPFFPEFKIFEMPVMGFLGFGPFALEMYVLYLFTGGTRSWALLGEAAQAGGQNAD